MLSLLPCTPITRPAVAASPHVEAAGLSVDATARVERSQRVDAQRSEHDPRPAQAAAAELLAQLAAAPR